MLKRLLAVLITCVFMISPQIFLVAQENESPFFKQVVIWGETAFAVSEDCVLYYWGADPRVKNGVITREPVKYMDGVSAIQNKQILKVDGSVFTLDGKAKLQETINKRAISGDLNNGLVIDNGVLMLVKDAEASLIAEGVVEIRTSSDNVHVAVLKQDSTLWDFELSKKTKSTLIADNVKSFDVSFMDKLKSISSYYIVKNNNSLWEIKLDDYSIMYDPYIILDEVQEIFCFDNDFLALKTDGVLLHGNSTLREDEINEGEYPYKFIIEKIMDRVSTACVLYGRYLAVKTDGTIWYWGKVIGGLNPNPQDRYVLYENQPTPVQLSFDPKVNSSYVRSRMEALLTEEDRLVALVQFYDYYAENLPDRFTPLELEEYKKYTLKAEEIEMQPSSKLVPESSSLPIQDNQDDGTTSYVIIFGATVIFILVLCLNSKKKT